MNTLQHNPNEEGDKIVALPNPSPQSFQNLAVRLTSAGFSMIAKLAAVYLIPRTTKLDQRYESARSYFEAHAQLRKWLFSMSSLPDKEMKRIRAASLVNEILGAELRESPDTYKALVLTLYRYFREDMDAAVEYFADLDQKRRAFVVQHITFKYAKSFN